MSKTFQILAPIRENPIFNDTKEFQLVGEIGDGAFSKVYEMIHIPTQKLYAIKEISLYDIEEEDLRNLESEIIVHSRLENDYIIKQYDFIKMEHSLFLILELAENGNLFKFLDRNHPLDEVLIKKCFYETCIS